MKKKFGLFIIFVVLLMTSVSLLCACDLFGGGNDDGEEPTQSYTIIYSDGSETHTLKVQNGEIFTIDKPLPQKTGYDFVGLYDMENGGVQYVTADGIAVAPFSDNKNMVLYPRFVAKEYTVVLDYQGATMTGERQFKAVYGENFPDLPTYVTADHKVFKGWYTAPNCKGKQVADEYGLLPSMSVLNSNNFSLSGDYINLYAGFEVDKYTVTLVFGNGYDDEKLSIEYDTPVSDIVPTTRVNGKAPISWSKTQNGEVFNGKITEEIKLYALEYAPIITFVNEGGEDVKEIIANAGASVLLPTPTKGIAQFWHWEDAEGKTYDGNESFVMPNESITLKAVWRTFVYASYMNSIKQTITDKSQNYYDTFDFRAMFGHSIEEYKAAGYKSVRFYISVDISEIDDGYQEIYLSQTTSTSGAIWKDTKIEHGSGRKDTSVWAHNYTCVFDLSYCKDVMYILYGANGSGSDNWYRHSLELTIDIYK